MKCYFTYYIIKTTTKETDNGSRITLEWRHCEPRLSKF